MAAAYKCDVCEKLFERVGTPDIRVVEYVHGFGEFRKDLCNECQKELETWLYQKVDKKNGHKEERL